MTYEEAEKYILDRVKDGKENEAKKAIKDFYQKQKRNEINTIYLLTFVPKMMGLLRPEFIGEVKDTFTKLSKNSENLKNINLD